MDGSSKSYLTDTYEYRECPKGMQEDYNQGYSETFAISKAIVNDLFVAKKINMNLNNISIGLAQAAFNKIEPEKYNGVTLLMQDIENQSLVHSRSRKAWWKV